jgi:hypothetical protein
MKTTVTNPFSLAIDFSGVVVKAGVSVLEGVPPDVLRSMADAGMLVESEPKAKAVEPPRAPTSTAVPAAAVPAPIPPAKTKSEAPVSLPKKPSE